MTTAAPPSLADEIREARLAAGLTQQQLADLIGISAASVRSWEQGQRVPRNSLALRLVRGILADLNDEGRPALAAPIQATAVYGDRHGSD